jgi:hypothetical protein
VENSIDEKSSKISENNGEEDGQNGEAALATKYYCVASVSGVDGGLVDCWMDCLLQKGKGSIVTVPWSGDGVM